MVLALQATPKGGIASSFFSAPSSSFGSACQAVSNLFSSVVFSLADHTVDERDSGLVDASMSSWVDRRLRFGRRSVVLHDESQSLVIHFVATS